jgi:aspartate kinase
MFVFKFGGASVKDADGLVNLANIVNKYAGSQLLIVVSAMVDSTRQCNNII